MHVLAGKYNARCCSHVRRKIECTLSLNLALTRHLEIPPKHLSFRASIMCQLAAIFSQFSPFSAIFRNYCQLWAIASVIIDNQRQFWAKSLVTDRQYFVIMGNHCQFALIH